VYTLGEALDQVFGAGAGQSAKDSGDAPPADDGTATPTPTTSPPRATTTAPPADGGGGSPDAARDKAVSDIDQALADLATAQRSGDFEAQGRALADLQRAVEAYRRTEQSGASASPTG